MQIDLPFRKVESRNQTPRSPLLSKQTSDRINAYTIVSTNPNLKQYRLYENLLSTFIRNQIDLYRWRKTVNRPIPRVKFDETLILQSDRIQIFTEHLLLNLKQIPMLSLEQSIYALCEMLFGFKSLMEKFNGRTVVEAEYCGVNSKGEMIVWMSLDLLSHEFGQGQVVRTESQVIKRVLQILRLISQEPEHEFYKELTRIPFNFDAVLGFIMEFKNRNGLKIPRKIFISGSEKQISSQHLSENNIRSDLLSSNETMKNIPDMLKSLQPNHSSSHKRRTSDYQRNQFSESKHRHSDAFLFTNHSQNQFRSTNQSQQHQNKNSSEYSYEKILPFTTTPANQPKKINHDSFIANPTQSRMINSVSSQPSKIHFQYYHSPNSNYGGSKLQRKVSEVQKRHQSVHWPNSQNNPMSNKPNPMCMSQEQNIKHGNHYRNSLVNSLNRNEFHRFNGRQQNFQEGQNLNQKSMIVMNPNESVNRINEFTLDEQKSSTKSVRSGSAMSQSQNSHLNGVSMIGSKALAHKNSEIMSVGQGSAHIQSQTKPKDNSRKQIVKSYEASYIPSVDTTIVKNRDQMRINMQVSQLDSDHYQQHHKIQIPSANKISYCSNLQSSISHGSSSSLNLIRKSSTPLTTYGVGQQFNLLPEYNKTSMTTNYRSSVITQKSSSNEGGEEGSVNGESLLGRNKNDLFTSANSQFGAYHSHQQQAANGFVPINDYNSRVGLGHGLKAVNSFVASPSKCNPSENTSFSNFCPQNFIQQSSHSKTVQQPQIKPYVQLSHLDVPIQNYTFGGLVTGTDEGVPSEIMEESTSRSKPSSSDQDRHYSPQEESNKNKSPFNRSNTNPNITQILIKTPDPSTRSLSKQYGNSKSIEQLYNNMYFKEAHHQNFLGLPDKQSRIIEAEDTEEEYSASNRSKSFHNQELRHPFHNLNPNEVEESFVFQRVPGHGCISNNHHAFANPGPMNTINGLNRSNNPQSSIEHQLYDSMMVYSRENTPNSVKLAQQVFNVQENGEQSDHYNFPPPRSEHQDSNRLSPPQQKHISIESWKGIKGLLGQSSFVDLKQSYHEGPDIRTPVNIKLEMLGKFGREIEKSFIPPSTPRASKQGELHNSYVVEGNHSYIVDN